ncbi:unnamed protein product [Kuraishia capsulata CBS 1993]|uniref:Uncharacterized protein n=1 Tax=Kuraishia capsulata CBS 1993 TaxID=1382522 RepID=W6MXY6_9ASCO|nr:uncharacterized protein KUCA_T00005693001 [Kuraishia capsulata CBS 1993]CDK29700.1 unnamed protein product [Kuraishia capsulata CBS 1993]
MYHSFIHRFVPSITLPYAHSALKAYSVAVPHVTNNSMVLDLFVACGALVMGFGNAATRDESLKYYRCCVMNLKTQINNQKINGTESWLLSALPILLIFEKHRGTSVTKSMKHLHGLYLMIKEREKQKMLTGGPKLGMVPDERSSLESFLYHYATGILFVSDEGLKKYLPRGVFRHLLKSLITPIYRSEIVWVNNPVLGGSIFLFEIVERISWFFRQHSSTGICDADEGNGLLKELDDWRFPGMPDTLAGLSEGRSLKAHHDAAMVWKNGARILLLKALHPDISENDIRIRTCVDDGRNWLEKIPLGGDTGCTGCTIFWPIAMIGCASTRQEDREFIRNMSTGLAEVVFSVSSYQLLDLCMHAWGEKTEFPERGLDVLYNRNIMDNYYL